MYIIKFWIIFSEYKFHSLHLFIAKVPDCFLQNICDLFNATLIGIIRYLNAIYSQVYIFHQVINLHQIIDFFQWHMLIILISILELTRNLLYEYKLTFLVQTWSFLLYVIVLKCSIPTVILFFFNCIMSEVIQGKLILYMSSVSSINWILWQNVKVAK